MSEEQSPEVHPVSIRPGEVSVDFPGAQDAQLVFIGRIWTPWTRREDCPRRGDPEGGPLCRIEIDQRWRQALLGIEEHSHLQVLYWMDRARRDLVVQAPHGREPRGTFSLRSPVRPNPIASSVVRLEGVDGTVLAVRGLDCLDGTPLLDLKPDICPAA